MEIENLSNIDLKKSLEAFGYDCGPVTSTTRSVYEKKLAKLQANSEREVLQTEDFSEEIVMEDSTEDVSKMIDVTDANEYSFTKDTFSTPRSYVPDGSNLTRRPLGQRTLTTKTSTTKVTTTTSATSSSDKNSSGFLRYCKYLLPVFIVIAILVILVYYHMEDGMFKELIAKS